MSAATLVAHLAEGDFQAFGPGRRLDPGRAPGEPVFATADEDGPFLASFAGSGVWVFDPATRRPLEGYVTAGEVRAIGADASGRFLTWAASHPESGRSGPVDLGLIDRRAGQAQSLGEVDTVPTCMAVDHAGQWVAVPAGRGELELRRVGWVQAERRFWLDPPEARDEPAPVEALAFCPEGDLLVVMRSNGDDKPRVVQVWEPMLGRLHADLLAPAWARGVVAMPRSWSPPADEVEALGWQVTAVEGIGVLVFTPSPLVAAVPSQSLVTAPGDDIAEDLGPTLGLAFLPGDRRAARLGPGMLHEIDVESGEMRPYPPPGPPLEPRALGVTREGTVLVAGEDGTVMGHTLGESGGGPIPTPVGGLAPGAVFAPDASRVATHGGWAGSRSGGGTVDVRALILRVESLVLEFGDFAPAGGMAFSSDGVWLAVGVFRRRVGEGGVRVVDLARPRRHRYLSLGPGRAEVVALSAGGELVAAGAPGEPVLVVATTEQAERIFELPVGPGGTSAVSFAPGGRLLAVAGCDGRLYLIDLRRARVVSEVMVPGGPLSVLAFDGAGDRLLAGGVCGGVWSFRAGELTGE
jgi:hypothetical protein